jgi:hypothetical protein
MSGLGVSGLTIGVMRALESGADCASHETGVRQQAIAATSRVNCPVVMERPPGLAAGDADSPRRVPPLSGEHEEVWGRLVTDRRYKVSGQTKQGCEAPYICQSALHSNPSHLILLQLWKFCSSRFGCSGSAP